MHRLKPDLFGPAKNPGAADYEQPYVSGDTPSPLVIEQSWGYGI